MGVLRIQHVQCSLTDLVGLRRHYLEVLGQRNGTQRGRTAKRSVSLLRCHWCPSSPEGKHEHTR